MSAYQHSWVTDAYLGNETRLGRVAGPFDAPLMQDLHERSFGVIPKKGSRTNGALSWAYPHCKATVSTMESILNLGISSTSKWMTFMSRWFLNLSRVPSWLNLTLSLHTDYGHRFMDGSLFHFLSHSLLVFPASMERSDKLQAFNSPNISSV